MLEVLKIIKDYSKENKIDINRINFTVLLNQDSSVYNDIKNAIEDNNRIALIYLYSNEMFNSAENKHRDEILEIFKNNKLKAYQMKYGYDVATNKDLYTKKDYKDIISLVVNAKGECQAIGGSKVATNKDVLARQDYKKIISLIVNAKGEYQALYGYYIATNKKSLARKNCKEMIRLIVEEEDVQRSLNIYNSIVFLLLNTIEFDSLSSSEQENYKNNILSLVSDLEKDPEALEKVKKLIKN